MNWQPIATAPKDGTPVWLGRGELFGLGEWVEFRGKWSVIFMYSARVDKLAALDELEQPTHWMPLPEPPSPSPSDRV